MRAAVLVAALSVAALVPAPLARGAGTPRAPRVAISATPVRLHVVGPSARRVELHNIGTAAVTVDATRVGRGGRPATRWISVVPRRLTLRPGAIAAVTVRVVPPRRAEPGDHDAVVLLTTRPLLGARVAVRTRLGVVVREHVAGRIVHRLELRRLRVRHTGRYRGLDLSLANRGNVTELVPRGRIVVSLVRHGRVVARIRPSARAVRPGGLRIVQARYRGRLHGPVTAVVRIRGVHVHRYRLRL
ncbi:MAG TPA: hypothetical protein VFI37_11790 [Gaiellaceae bacterium]|jgi:hypothetical protein|nr:hypothetical protein [Gaiellaceae bacterium]